MLHGWWPRKLTYRPFHGQWPPRLAASDAENRLPIHGGQPHRLEISDCFTDRLCDLTETPHVAAVAMIGAQRQRGRSQVRLTIIFTADVDHYRLFHR